LRPRIESLAAEAEPSHVLSPLVPSEEGDNVLDLPQTPAEHISCLPI
jgi:hypothetical protein